MPLDIKDIADKADMIINGYAFTRDGEYIRLLNLEHINHAAVIFNNKINDREVRQIRAFIKIHYKEMYFKWQELADTGYFGE